MAFPDPSANPYLAFTAILMAGLDGIERRLEPGDAADRNLYDLPPEDGDGGPAAQPLADRVRSAARDTDTAGKWRYDQSAGEPDDHDRDERRGYARAERNPRLLYDDDRAD